MAKTRKTATKKTASSAKTRGSRKRKAKVADPITLVTDQNRPDENSATFGNPAEVNGVEGYIVTATTYDDKTGYPDEVLFRPRDNGNTLMTVKYDDVKALDKGYR